jgi:hypothetical protein
MQDTLRGIIVDVSRDVVIDVVKTTWTTATRPAPAEATVVIQASVETADVWADVTAETGVPGDRAS